MKSVFCLIFGLVMGQVHATGPYPSDVIGVQEQQLSADYWISRTSDAHQILLDRSQIQTLNEKTFEQQPELIRLVDIPGQLTSTQLRERIEQVSSIPSGDRFYADGRKLTKADYQKYVQNMNLDGVKKLNPVRFALVTQRTNMRRFPSADKTYNEAMDLDIDRFIETGLFPGDALAVYHESLDGQWVLARAYHYLAWLPKADIAIGDREAVLHYGKKAPFAVVTGAKVFTNFNPEVAQLSEKQLDMGVRLPLWSNAAVKHDLYGQNPYASHVVELPYREEDGSLSFKPALISKNQDVHLGYLPYTRANIIKQGFKFLGERYGWGHDYNARDCTGFVSEIYRTFGILMPRNSGQQGKGSYGQNRRFDANSSEEDKLSALRQLDVGDLIYFPGHVVMYLGDEQGEPYVIHDVHGMAYQDAQGNYYQGGLNGVSVTPLLPMRLSSSISYLDRIYTIKSIR
ncbi:NlpC/P60 family protein [Bowmanella dokdonensis]|uniref:SH3 domain-containing protein n=1 Tax=Bowmanella dokdonensis TaxID=751969 RepID=A0A939DQT3_9ALTE|nr:NlpC/P60 family protein [Bowmanella dokdonensis]MBN7827284.1 SH3 domain-containing protein [Bowmanella dokdonensis]